VACITLVVTVSQDVHVVSYITELTGLTKDILDQNGLPLAEALALLRAHLPPHAILVGQVSRARTACPRSLAGSPPHPHQTVRWAG
jgi:hypothetical protein